MGYLGVGGPALPVMYRPADHFSCNSVSKNHPQREERISSFLC
jgi:hypothetical protein